MRCPLGAIAKLSQPADGGLLRSQDAYFCAKFVHLLHNFGYLNYPSPVFYDMVRARPRPQL